MEEKVWFEFLQVAVGNRESLSGGISDADWLRLFDFCKKQALIGGGFTAVEKRNFLLNEKQWTEADEPWMICAPNEKEGSMLLEEIMKGGNFG